MLHIQWNDFIRTSVCFVQTIPLEKYKFNVFTVHGKTQFIYSHCDTSNLTIYNNLIGIEIFIVL